MSLARRQAIISLVLWGAIVIGMVIVVARTGLAQLSEPDNKAPRTALSLLLLPGLLVSTWFALRQSRARRAGLLDERDEQVARRASELTLIAVTVFFYAAGSVLWEVYEGGSGAPAGIFYLAACSAVALMSLIHAAARLVFDARGLSDG